MSMNELIHSKNDLYVIFYIIYIVYSKLIYRILSDNRVNRTSCIYIYIMLFADCNVCNIMQKLHIYHNNIYYGV